MMATDSESGSDSEFPILGKATKSALFAHEPDEQDLVTILRNFNLRKTTEFYKANAESVQNCILTIFPDLSLTPISLIKVRRYVDDVTGLHFKIVCKPDNGDKIKVTMLVNSSLHEIKAKAKSRTLHSEIAINALTLRQIRVYNYVPSISDWWTHHLELWHAILFKLNQQHTAQVHFANAYFLALQDMFSDTYQMQIKQHRPFTNKLLKWKKRLLTDLNKKGLTF